tara:strand:+ start:24374 stop:24613 length:240 start_codon:yes stop_codon:yes gene_type:complete
MLKSFGTRVAQGIKDQGLTMRTIKATLKKDAPASEGLLKEWSKGCDNDAQTMSRMNDARKVTVSICFLVGATIGSIIND